MGINKLKTMENNSDDWKPTFRGATWNLIINIALACFFYIYAFNNPDAGSCFAKDGFETARAEVPISVPATSSSEAVFARGYHSVQRGAWLCHADEHVRLARLWVLHQVEPR